MLVPWIRKIIQQSVGIFRVNPKVYSIYPVTTVSLFISIYLIVNCTVITVMRVYFLLEIPHEIIIGWEERRQPFAFLTKK